MSWEGEVLDAALQLEIDTENEAHLLFIARELVDAPLPRQWERLETNEEQTNGIGHKYYYNRNAKETTWDHPLLHEYRAKLSLIRNEEKVGLDDCGEMLGAFLTLGDLDEVESVVEDGKSSLVEEHTPVKGADEERRKLSKNVFVEATKKVQEIDCGTAPSLIEFNAMRNALADAKRAEAKAEHYLELERMRSSSRHQRLERSTERALSEANLRIEELEEMVAEAVRYKSNAGESSESLQAQLEHLKLMTEENCSRALSHQGVQTSTQDIAAKVNRPICDDLQQLRNRINTLERKNKELTAELVCAAEANDVLNKNCRSGQEDDRHLLAIARREIKEMRSLCQEVLSDPTNTPQS